jgi:flagellar motor switch protein FliN/FliY
MQTANEPVAGQAAAAPAPAHEAAPAAWKPLQPAAAKPAAPAQGMNMILDVPVQLAVELGRAKMSLREVMELREGSVIQLNKSAGEPVALYVNEQLVAKGEIVLVEDFLGVRITELTGEAQ